MDKDKITKLQKEAELLARKAGNILLEYRNKAIVKTRKSDYLDIVTDADLASEKFLLTEINKRHPTHNILSEETGNKNIQSEFTWVIDPLDGTKEYIRGTPMFNVSIAIEYNGEVIVGVVFRPETNELYSASLGNGSFLNGRKLKVSQTDKITNSIIYTDLPHRKDLKKEISLTLNIINNLIPKSGRVRTFQEDAAILCWLAFGALEGHLLAINGPHWWDVAPGILIAKEAGGKITDTEGNEIKNRNLSKGLIASNGKIHDQLLNIIKKCKEENE